MSEQTTVSTETTNTTAQQPVTLPQAANVDINSIITQAESKASEAAEKKMDAVFKSMLEQNGLDAETINKMTAEWKSKQQTPEQAMQELNNKYQAEQAKNEILQQQILAIGKGVPADKADKYIALAKSYLGDDKDFNKALDAALADFPIEKKQAPPPYAAGTGSSPMLGVNGDTLLLREASKKLNEHRIVR